MEENVGKMLEWRKQRLRERVRGYQGCDLRHELGKGKMSRLSVESNLEQRSISCGDPAMDVQTNRVDISRNTAKNIDTEQLSTPIKTQDAMPNL